MDLTIPEGMGGKEAIRRLKALDPDAKAIVSSGYSYDPVMANFQEYGFCGVIPKPYVMEELGRVLAEVAGKKAAAQTTA
jgi:DNA-binding NarL/FixJ family response regulator